MEKLQEFKIFMADTNETIILQLTPEIAKKASEDDTFLIELVNNEYEKRSRQVCEQLTHNSSDYDLQLSESLTLDTMDIVNPLLSVNNKSKKSDCEVKDESESEKSLFIWPSQLVILLLDMYEKRKEEFKSGTKRHQKIWESIAKDMQKINPKCIATGQQCQSKLNGLKKNYKKILDHNSVSGNDRKTWIYFERMHEIFEKAGWANPKVIASEAGLSSVPLSSKNEDLKEKSKKRKVDSALNDILENMKNKQIKKEEEKKENTVKFEVFMQQRKQQHEEKMTMMQRLLDVISKKTD